MRKMLACSSYRLAQKARPTSSNARNALSVPGFSVGAALKSRATIKHGALLVQWRACPVVTFTISAATRFVA